MAEKIVNNRLSSEQDQKYYALVSYLLHSRSSGSDFFILRPGHKLKFLDLEEDLLKENGQYIIDYLLQAEKNGAEIYIRKPNDKLKRVLLREWFKNAKNQGRIARLISN